MTRLSVVSPFATAPAPDGWSILVHGGAGDTPVTPERVAGCRAAANAGARVLRAGGTAVDAVEQAVRVLEDDPFFNAGTGSVLNEAGLIELDAAVMEGATLRAGGVCALPPFANPISIARAVLEKGGHVLYAGQGAVEFARAAGFVPSTNEAMTTARARAAWEARRARGVEVPNEGGTVGAVARDRSGTCAAATSTGGIAGKRLGRVGDSPIIGAGTYADEVGAASATGHGELILRTCLTKRAVDALRDPMAPDAAAAAALSLLADRLGGTAGIIVVDRKGHLGLARSTGQMAWAASLSGEGDVTAGT